MIIFNNNIKQLRINYIQQSQHTKKLKNNPPFPYTNTNTNTQIKHQQNQTPLLTPQKMQQHYQVINLHNIIRSQQSKIQQLRQQLSIANQRQETRYKQFSQNHKNILQEKQKMIQYLKQELTKSQGYKNANSQLINQKYERELEKVEKESIIQKRKNIELEAKFKSLEKEYQVQIQNYNGQITRINQQLKKYKEYKANISVEVTKLNHFYKNSLFDITKRKETLLWVNKFTQYLQKQQIKDQRILADISNFIKIQINNLKNSLAQLITQTNNNLLSIHTTKIEIYEELNDKLQEIKKQCVKLTNQNSQLFTHVLKEEKEFQKKQEVRCLQAEITQLQNKYNSDVELYKGLIKNMQRENKTLLLGFQELRSLTEHKQTIYKEQTQQLKKTIQELIETATERDRQFENQIKILTSQIQNISDRYYENIQNPMKKINFKISQEIEMVKSSLSRMQSDQAIRSSIQNLERMLGSRVYSGGSGGSVGSGVEVEVIIKEYVASSNKMVAEILELLTNSSQSGNVGSGGSGKENSFSKFFSSKGIKPNNNNTFQKQYEQLIQQQQINLRQKFNKSQYQVTLAKKHLSKLKQYCQSLQKRLANQIVPQKKNSSTNLNMVKGNSYKYSPQKKLQKQKQKPKIQKQSQKIMQLNKRILELQAQNQSLKQNQNFIKLACQQQIQNMKKKRQIISLSQQSIHSTQQAFKQSLYRLNQINNKIVQHLKVQKQHINQVKQNIKILKNVLVRPMESFQMFFKEVWEVGILSQTNNLNGGNTVPATDRSNNQFGQISNLNTQRFMNTDQQGSNLNHIPQLHTQRLTSQPHQISQITQRNHKSYISHFSVSDQIKNYKEILSKKTENNHNISKLMFELIKSIKQSNIKQLKQKLVHHNNAKKQDEHFTKKNDNRLKNLQKKFKQMQNQRIKEKHEMIQKIQKIQGKIEKLNSKINKYLDLKASLSKLQGNLDSKINDIVSKTQVKIDKNQILTIKDQVINDLKSKLQETNIENQGLRKQMAIHFAQRKF